MTEVLLKSGKVVLRRLTWGEVRESLRRAIVGDKVDMVLREDHQILMSIVEAPFQKSLDGLRALDWEEGEKIKKAFEALNKPTKEQKKV